MKYTGQTMDAMRETLKEGAEKDVKTRLVLEAICDAEKIEPTKEEVDAEIEKYAENMGDNKQKFIDSLTDSDRSYFEKTCKMLKTIEMLKDSAVEPEA